MAKTHADRLAKFGKFGRYNDMIDRVLAHNKADVTGKVVNIQMDDWNKAFRELSAQGDAGSVRFVLPSASGVTPTKKVIHAKAVETGKIMSKTLRQNLRKKMMETLQEYIDEKKTPYMTKRGELRGKMDPDLITKFEAKVKEAFEGYTKRDRTVGMPKNIHTIAVTEMRSAVNNGKKSYAEKVRTANPGLKMMKRWIHNDWLVQEPRPGHRRQDIRYGGEAIPATKDFIVEVYKWMGGKYHKTGTVRMQHPHDQSAPLSELCGCVPKNTKIWAGEVKNLMRRKYSGIMCEIKTLQGLKVRLTPNHPVLTDKGWVRADRLVVGSNVVCMNFRKKFDIPDVNINNRPFILDKIFDFFHLVFIVFGITGSNANFNSKRKTSNVDIIPVDSKLMGRFYSSIFKPLYHFLFTLTSYKQKLLISQGAFMSRFIGHCRTLPFFVSLGSKLLSVLKRSFIHPYFLRFAIASRKNIVFKETFPNRSSVNMKNLSKMLFCNPGDIFFDKVGFIKNNSFHGFVYNLQTKNKMYGASSIYHIGNAKSIILHNCQCDIEYFVKR